MKEKLKYLVVLIVFIIFIPKIEAKEVKKTYTNYYFFLEPYEEKTSDTVNYTAFPPLEVGRKNLTEAKQIPLSHGCTEEKEKNDVCWSYTTFYKKYIELEGSSSESKEYSIGDVSHESRVITKIESGVTKKYYSHGSYYDKENKKWLKLNWSKIKNDSSSLSCASIPINNAELTIVDINLRRTSNINSYNPFYIEIKRTLTNAFGNVDWDASSNNNQNKSNCSSNNIIPFDGSVYSPVVYKYEYTVTENKCNENKQEKSELKCNDSSELLNSTCENLTIVADKSHEAVDVEIKEEAVVTNLLTPTTIFAGGGFKFGILYTNTIRWGYVDETPSNNVNEEVADKMKNKIKSLTEFTDELSLSDVTFGGKTINSSLFQKNCTQTGSFKAGDTLTTTCTIFLPKSKVDEYTGEIHYNVGTDNGINNKYYTNQTDKGNYKIKVTIESMSIIKDFEAKKDSENSNRWNGNWNITLNDCNINIYSLIQTESGKYKFIYRPIDIRNPFPGRNAGINWYDWYKNTVNKERLEDTYTNLDYTVLIDNVMLSKIKDYNNNRNYFDFYTMENNKSTFLDDYFPNARVGENK